MANFVLMTIFLIDDDAADADDDEDDFDEMMIKTAERPGRCCKEASRRQDKRPAWKDYLDNSDYYLNYQIIIRLFG